MTSDGPAAIRARQQRHWAEVLAANPDMYGLEPSSAAIHAAEQFAVRGVTTVLELGAGQGRDTMFLGHTGDAHYGTGVPHGDEMFEQGGFIVHFFNDELVQQVAEGFELIEVTSFTEGDLPRRLWRVTMRKPD